MIVNHPAAGRNAEPLYGVVREQLVSLAASSHQTSVNVLELASGPGQHIEYFAARNPEVRWQPTEPQAELRASIDARVAQAGLNNVAPALNLDVCADWPKDRFDLILAVNLLHISPWSVTQALVANAASVASEGAVLLIYGPFRRNGEHTSPGNQAFDLELRERDSRWGIRDLELVAELAGGSGWRGPEVVGMPANNFCLVFGG